MERWEFTQWELTQHKVRCLYMDGLISEAIYTEVDVAIDKVFTEAGIDTSEQDL